MNGKSGGGALDRLTLSELRVVFETLERKTEGFREEVEGLLGERVRLKRELAEAQRRNRELEAQLAAADRRIQSLMVVARLPDHE